MDENKIENDINVISNNKEEEEEDIHHDTNEKDKNFSFVIEGNFRSLGVNTDKLSPKELSKIKKSMNQN